MKTEAGLFVTFEGIDGSGKSTQIKALMSSLADRNLEAVLIREPGGTRIGEEIRHLLLNREHDGMFSQTELLLYEAARAQIVREVIAPAINAGKIVVCDRFFDSTTVYQGSGRGLNGQMIEMLNVFATGGLEPHLTFLLDLPATVAKSRMQIRADETDRLEAEGESFMERVRQGYLSLAEQSGRFCIIDATKPIEDISKQIDAKFWEVVYK